MVAQMERGGEALGQDWDVYREPVINQFCSKLAIIGASMSSWKSGAVIYVILIHVNIAAIFKLPVLNLISGRRWATKA